MRTYWETYDQVKEESTERTPTQIVVWVAVTSRHQASGLPSLSSQQGEGVQDVFISGPPAHAFEGESVGETEHLQQFVTLHDSGAVNGKCFAAWACRGGLR